MIREEEIIEVGKFFKPHGLKGELNVTTIYDAGILEEGYPLIVDIDGIFVPFYAEGVRPKGNFSSLVKLESIDDKDKAAALVNKKIYMLRKDVALYLDMEESELEDETDIVGYTLRDTEGNKIGKIVDIDDSTDNVLLCVRPDESDEPDEEILVPMHEDLIEAIDEELQEITMQLPEGLTGL